MIVRNQKELEALQRIGEICGETLKHMLAHVEPGISTLELDQIGAAFLKKHGAASAPITAYKYPGWTCISINEQVAHGIPGKRIVKEGDVVNVDVSAVLEGYWADTGASMLIAPNKPRHEKLLKDTLNALYAGIAAVKANQPVYEIGRVIESLAKKGNYRIIRQLSGHGIGRHIHEEPNVPNFFTRLAHDKMLEGMVFTIEPFFNLGRGMIVTDRDKWTLRTPDKSISAQFEHTIVVTDGEPILLTKVDGGH